MLNVRVMITYENAFTFDCPYFHNYHRRNEQAYLHQFIHFLAHCHSAPNAHLRTARMH